MSANNLIKVFETFKGTWSAAEYDADTGAQLTFISNEMTQNDAIDKAHEYMEKVDHEIEYGVQV